MLDAVNKKIRIGCISLLRKFPSSSDIVADILEQVEGNAMEKPPSPRKIARRQQKKTKTKRVVSSKKTKRLLKALPIKALSVKKKKLKKAFLPTTFQIIRTGDKDMLVELHGKRKVFRLHKEDYLRIQKAISEGAYASSDIISKTGLKEYLVHVALRFLQQQMLVSKQNGKFYPVATDNWSDKAYACWEDCAAKGQEQVIQASAG